MTASAETHAAEAPKIETLTDARAELIAFLRSELAEHPEARLLVFGDGDPRLAVEALGPELASRALVALGASAAAEALAHAEGAFDLVWLVGPDSYRGSVGTLVLDMLARARFAPGARVAFITQHVCELFVGLQRRLDTATVRNLAKVDRLLVIATMNGDAATPPPKTEPI